MRPQAACLTAALCLAAGCAAFAEKDPIGRISGEVALSERAALESHTRSRLAAIERSLNDYIQAKGHIPPRLELLVPDYLAEIPDVVLGIKGHKDNRRVQYYPAELIQGGQINGSLIEDSGGWGYAHSDRQVIVFVDCTHKSLDGTLWFQMRGVY